MGSVELSTFTLKRLSSSIGVGRVLSWANVLVPPDRSTVDAAPVMAAGKETLLSVSSSREIS